MKKRGRMKYSKTPNWMIRRREKVLGEWFLDNEVEVLKKLPLYMTRQFNILKGRKNVVKGLMKPPPLGSGMTKKNAIIGVYKAFRAAGYKVAIGDYIQHYAYE